MFVTAALVLVTPTAATARSDAKAGCSVYGGGVTMAMSFVSKDQTLARAFCIYEAHVLGSGYSWAPGIKRFSAPTYPVCSYRTTSALVSPITVSIFTTRAFTGLVKAASCTTAIWNSRVWTRVS